MPTNDNEELHQLVRDIRGIDNLQASTSELEEIRSFLQGHEAESVRTATHSVLENFPDWWVRGRRAPPGLEFETAEDFEELYRHAGFLYGLGIPLTLAERRTSAFRFFQDLEAWGNGEVSLSVEDLIDPESALTRLVGTLIGEVFPNHGGFLDVAVYDATGMSQTKGIRKTSIRLVWPGIVVDSDRAARVRDLLVHKLTSASSEDGDIAELEARLKALNANNAWHGVFGDAAYGSRAGVRMPCSDRVAPLPLRAPEKRPLGAVGVLRFFFEGGNEKMKVEWLCRQSELDHAEWIKIGCLRQANDVQLTEWSVPSWPSNQPVPPSSTRTGRVKVRTAGGSENIGGGLRLKCTKVTAPPPERAGALLTVERKFSSSPEEFCSKMEQHLGKAVVEADGSYVWKQPSGDARIVMYTDDMRIKVIGRPNQVRSLVVIVSPYTEAQSQLVQGGDRLQQGPLGDGRAPSDAFAPQGMQENQGANASQNDQNQDNVDEKQAPARVVIQEFEPQGQGELLLERDQRVRVTVDPEGGPDASEDRWVYGRNEASGQCGWFPLSHTILEDETSTA